LAAGFQPVYLDLNQNRIPCFYKGKLEEDLVKDEGSVIVIPLIDEMFMNFRSFRAN
jgi:hypothetical protein